MSVKVTYKVRREGPTSEEILERLLKQRVDDILADAKATPDAHPGTPYKDTGELVRGLHFVRAGVKLVKDAGVIGRIKAPVTRLASRFVHRGFVRLLRATWDDKGSFGWSRGRVR